MCANISAAWPASSHRSVCRLKERRREKERSPALFAHKRKLRHTLNALIPVCLQW